MSLCLKGRIWRDGKNWRATLPGLDLSVKGAEKIDVMKELEEKIDEISDDLDYEITTEEDGLLIFETDEVAETALLILKRRIIK
ncbi:MAG TPA: hypothetical protein VE954_43375 [Oligoflexus sp.]|uniref:hypothetical protein n=1 Tax=Oligoflexus sp. TaxID=1971216 RepID=UPI002D635AA6|nr:hypothetical protein [Oligoflexus sp.]HYX39987.1 hypothetical protein [Oligoflexus sp.]